MATTNSNASNHAPGPGQNTVTPPRPNNPSAPAKANSSDVGKGGSAAFGKKERKQDKTLGVDIANRMKDGPFQPLSRHLELESLTKELCTSVEKDSTSMLILNQRN